jgi:predicted RNA binding protein YcfA (HicA-like mRNA interferase family)
MKVRELIRLLEQNGWVEMRSKGSHRHFKHPGEALVLQYPATKGRSWPPAR